VSAYVGGELSQRLTPDSALHIAALIIACAPAAVMVATLFLVREAKTHLDLSRMKATARDLISAMKSRTLWIVAGFLVFWNITPGFGTPLYYHMVDHLRFDQAFIGKLGSIAAIGAVIGAYFYRRFLAGRYTTKTLVYVSIALGSGTTLAYLLLADRTSAVLLYFGTGILSMIPLLTLLSLAASVCPPQAAGFTFAALMSIYNAAAQVSAIIGARLYDQVFHQQMAPLIWVAALFTLGAYVLVPFLPRTAVEQEQVLPAS
jgi:predicted MFS family arabinose efflux permease